MPVNMSFTFSHSARVHYAGIADEFDNCPHDPNANQDDPDFDGIGSECVPQAASLQLEIIQFLTKVEPTTGMTSC